MKDFSSIVGYIPLTQPVQFKGFEAVGYFPYCVARVSAGIDTVCPPRGLFAYIEVELPFSDNKYVLICKDTTRFGTDNFAIMFYDLYVKIGKCQDVKAYDGGELEQKC